MKSVYTAIVLIAALTFSEACTKERDTPTKAEQATLCDRACLEGFADQYLAALVAHNASQPPLNANARYTENGQDLKMNNGMWQVATALGSKKLYFSHPPSGQVGARTIVEENGRKEILITRLKIENQKISVIEVPCGMPSGWSKST
jgi:hypothetical protein